MKKFFGILLTVFATVVLSKESFYYTECERMYDECIGVGADPRQCLIQYTDCSNNRATPAVEAKQMDP